MDVEGRLTLCNMMVETGSEAAIMPFDEMTERWLKPSKIHGDHEPVKADDDAHYEREIAYISPGWSLRSPLPIKSIMFNLYPAHGEFASIWLFWVLVRMGGLKILRPLPGY